MLFKILNQTQKIIVAFKLTAKFDKDKIIIKLS